jgi:hypothetical protein
VFIVLTKILYNQTMASFDVSKEWAIVVPQDIPHVKKSVEDLSRCIGLLAGESPKAPLIVDALGPAPSGAVIALSAGGGGPERNGFEWRVGNERVEISGESGRGLCNGIYSFLAALGISWPAPGQEKIPAKTPAPSPFSLASGSVSEPSCFEGKNPAAAPWRRFVPAENREIRAALNKSEAFTAWTARRRYDAFVFPLAVFDSGKNRRKLMQLKQSALEYDIALEAGGRDLSSLVPRRYFFFHRDFFRMEEGKRNKDHHFCPTSPGAVKIIGKEGSKLLQAAEAGVFHLWPDEGAETAWCSCPACRAFTSQEQYRMGVNAAADVLATLNPSASITLLEKPGESGKIPLRKNIFRIERVPDGKESS